MNYTIELHWSKEEFPLVYNNFPNGIETFLQWKCKPENEIAKLIEGMHYLYTDCPIVYSQTVDKYNPRTRVPQLELYKASDYQVEAKYCSDYYKQGMEIVPTNTEEGADITYNPKPGAKPIWAHDNPTSSIRLNGLSIVIRITP